MYKVSIVDQNVIPRKWLTADIDKITAFVNKTNGEVPIPGVEIIVESDTKFRKR